MAISFGFVSCDNSTEKEEAIETDPIVFNKEAEVYLINSSGDTLRKIDVELAETDYEKQTGLMYRENLGSDQGMLFVYDSERVRNFYMIGINRFFFFRRIITRNKTKAKCHN